MADTGGPVCQYPEHRVDDDDDIDNDPRTGLLPEQGCRLPPKCPQIGSPDRTYRVTANGLKQGLVAVVVRFPRPVIGDGVFVRSLWTGLSLVRIGRSPTLTRSLFASELWNGPIYRHRQRRTAVCISVRAGRRRHRPETLPDPSLAWAGVSSRSPRRGRATANARTRTKHTLGNVVHGGQAENDTVPIIGNWVTLGSRVRVLPMSQKCERICV